MPSRGLPSNRRGLTEGTGMAILVAVTVLVTASVAINVLVVGGGDTAGVQANFSFDYVEVSQALIVTHERGDEIEAGRLLIVGENAEVTWAVLAGVNDSTAIGPGDSVQISKGNEYGHWVRPDDRIDVYRGSGANRTRLDVWMGPDRELARVASAADRPPVAPGPGPPTAGRLGPPATRGISQPPRRTALRPGDPRRGGRPARAVRPRG